jgi:hypothetical protein
MKKNLTCFAVLIVLLAGCIKTSVGEKNVFDAGTWKVATMENSSGYIQPITRVRNKFGFILVIYINKKGEKTAGLVIPSKYYRIADNAVLIQFQVDDYQMQRKTFNMELEGHGANFYLTKKDIRQIKRGYKIKINYLSEIGWSETISFDLTNSHKSISYIFNND